MKKIILIFSVLVLCACAKQEQINYLVFSGTIINSNSDSIIVSRKDFRKVIAINEKGSFYDTLFIDNGYYSFRIGRESSALFLQNGKSLNLNINIEEFDESIKYSGIGAAENNVLASTYLIEEVMMGGPTEFYSQDENQFISSCKAIKDSIVQLINNQKIDANFKADQLNNAKYNYARQLLIYPTYHRHYADLPDFKVSADFKSNQVEFSINDENAFKNSSAYVDLINTVFEQKINEAPDSISYSQAIFNATEEWPKGLIRDELLNDMAAYIISPNEELETTYQFLINAVSDTSYHAKYTALYQKMVLLQKGNPSPSFVDYENHAGGTSSLKDLLGKYVYIDVWATWCGPCIREIPALKEIEAVFHNKNIHFVSISVDRENDHETWIKMVKDKELSGIQLFADQAWESDFIRAYEINSIPRFILIDPSGKIIDADAARPSSPKLLELLNELKI